MIKPLQRMVGPYGKPIKIKALTPMIPRGESQYDNKGAFNGIVPFSLDMLKLEELEETSYIIPKQEIQYLVEHNDMEDWKKLLGMFDGLLGNMMRLLNNIRRENYIKITYLKIEEQEIERRHNKLQEKLLDFTQKNDEVDAKTKMTDKEKIEKLKKTLGEMGFAAGAAAAVAAGTVILNGNVKQKAVQLAKQLMSDLGLTDFQAAGIVGNLLSEGFGKGIPDDIEDGRYSRESGPPPDYGTMLVGYGWAQWTNTGNNGPTDRLNKFIIRLGGGPGKQARAATDSDNYSYLLDDFRTGYSSVLSNLKSTTNITDAARIILTQYEIPANQSQSVVQQRAAQANTILQEMKKASGAIVLPQLFDDHKITYDTFRKNTFLSNFIVDKPTIIDMKDIGEPLVIIPTERPIGQNILKILFERPFQKIEQTFLRLNSNKKEKSTNPKNSQSYINPTMSMVGSTSPSAITSSQNDTQQPSYSKQSEINTQTDNITSRIESSQQKIPDMMPLQLRSNTQETVIDNVSNSTTDIFDIPIERLIVQNILKILFERPFQKIEQTFLKLNSNKKEKSTNPKNSQSYINRTTITPTMSMVGSTSPSAITSSQNDTSQQKIPDMMPLQLRSNTQETVIDNVSNSTTDIFDIPMVLIQDYYLLEE